MAGANGMVCLQTCLAQSQLAERPRRELFETIKLSELPADTLEVAEQLEILQQLRDLYDPKKELTHEERDDLRHKVLESILESYMDAQSVQAEADREVGYLEAFRDKMLDKRDRSVNLNNATNFIASGTLNTIGSILGFSADTPPFPGNLNQMLSGVVSAGMSTYSLKQQRGGKFRGVGKPNMLAELFGRPIDAQTTYPETVWRFFHGSVPETPSLNRAQFLEKLWIERSHLEPHGSRRESLKIDLVCGLMKPGTVLTIDDVSDQIAMINDVSTYTELMTHHLRDLLRLIDSDVVPERK